MSFHMNSIEHNQRVVRTERIYIDPQYLISLKSKKRPFKIVPSVYEPPQQQTFQKDQVLTQKIRNSKLNVKNMSLQSKISSKQFFQIQNEIFPQEKIKNLQQILQGQAITPNVQYIWKLLPSSYKKEVINFQEGDCIRFNPNNEQKLLILSGEVRIIGTNEHTFKRKAGFIVFLSNETKHKIKQILVLRSTKILKISNLIFSTVLSNYIFLKNSEKIKFIRYCPFFIWKKQLTEDLAACMEMKCTQKQEIIYQAHSNPEAIYFVKEGIVLLERNMKVQNPIVSDFELHYEKNQITEKDTILVVRKGMAFGIDGIIIKQFLNKQKSRETLKKINPEDEINQKNVSQMELSLQNSLVESSSQSSRLQNNRQRKNSRIYTAKTLGKCELYVLQKKVLQTLFSVSDINEQMYIKRKSISTEQLERMSVEYTRMIQTHSQIHHPQNLLKKKDLVLNLKASSKYLPKKSQSLANLDINTARSQKQSQNQKRFRQFSDKKISVLPSIKKKMACLEQNLKHKLKIKNEIFWQQSHEKAILKGQIKSERQKQFLSGIRKARNTQKTSQKKGQTKSQNANLLPKLMSSSINSQQRSLMQKLQADSTKFQPLNTKQQNQKVKISEIIEKIVKDQMKQIKQTSLEFKNIQKVSSSELGTTEKLQQQQFSKFPAFINIKSYRSIIFPHNI